MAINIGDRIPSAQLAYLEDGIQQISTDELFAGKTVVLFAVPGAFTPTCSARHLPGFVDQLPALKAKGVDAVVCVAVNDPFVMDAWKKQHGVPAALHVLADGNASFTKALGLEFDASPFGMGVRSQRYALVAKDGTVTQLFVEAPGEFKVSSVDHVLSQL